ncbi:hypothetical protein HKX48_001896 [Thoreauomyces humboldtii]|nr:hypothetical protein HKX48_001896 [Thoreauomyces humboldtii]
MLRAHDMDLERRALRIAFYISGHGLGHATRSIATIRHLLTLGHVVTIISSTAAFIFEDLLARFPQCTLRNTVNLDPGVVQKDAVTVDVERSMAQLRVFLDGMEEVARKEAEWMAGQEFDVACLDAPFLPARVAKAVGVPSILITNFTFDAIFAGIASTAEDLALVTRCEALYALSDHLIRIPGHLTMPAFSGPRSSQIVDVPLVVRKSVTSRASVRARLDIPADAPCVLITFGGFYLADSHCSADEDLPDGWYGLMACPTDGASTSGRLRRIRTEAWYMPDLINAADVVVGKCGYGTCSEVVAHGVPLVYVPRSGFVEEQALIDNLMTPYGFAVEMPQKAFYEGNWEPYILEAAAMPGKVTPKAIRHDGEVLASELVVDIARQHRGRCIAETL